MTSRFATAMLIGLVAVICVSQPLFPSPVVDKFVVLARKEGPSSDDAWKALGETSDSTATDALIALLMDENPEMRAQAARTLGARRDTRAVDALIVALSDRSVRDAAAEALGEIGDPKAICPLVAVLGAGYDPERVRNDVVSALARFGLLALDPLLDAFKTGDANTHRSAAHTIYQIAINRSADSRVVIPMISALKDRDGYVVGDAAHTLSDVKDVRALEPLLTALADEKCSDRSAVAYALGEIGDSRAMKPLTAALKDRDEYVRREAASALGRLGDAQVLNALAALGKDESLVVRQAAGISLLRHGDVRGVSLVLGSSEYDIDYYTSALIRSLGPKAVGPLIQGYETTEDPGARRHILSLLVETGDPRAVKLLLVALKDQDPSTRSAARSLLSSVHDERSLKLLIPLMADKNCETRSAAISAFARLGDRRASSALLSMLSEQPKRISEDVIELLLRLNDPATLATATKLIKRPDVAARVAGLRILDVMCDPRGVEPTLEMLKDPDPQVRVSAVQALVSMGDDRAADAILSSVKDRDSTVRYAAVKALGEFKSPSAMNALVSALKDRDPQVCAEAARSLGSYRSPSLVQPLLDAMNVNDWDRRADDLLEFLETMEGSRTSIPQIRENASRSLAKMGPSAVDALLSCLSAPDPVTKTLAIEALGQTGDARVVAPLIAVMKDTSPPVSFPQIDESWQKALSKVKDPEQRRLISQMREDMAKWYASDESQYAVRDLAADSLRELSGAGVADAIAVFLNDSDPFVKSVVPNILAGKNDSRAVDSLVATLDGSDPPALRAAAKALAGMSEPHAIEACIHALQNPDPLVRAVIFEYTQDRDDPRMIEPVAKLMSDADLAYARSIDLIPIRQLAALKLARLGDGRGLNILLDALSQCVSSPDSTLAPDAVVHALFDIKSLPDTGRLLAACKDSDPSVRLVALSILARNGKAKLEDLLATVRQTLDAPPDPERVWESDSRRGQVAVMCVVGFADKRATDLMLYALSHGGHYAQCAAVEALGDVKEVRAVDPLIKLLDKSDSLVVESLGEIGDQRAIEPIILVFACPGQSIEETAPDALKRLTGQDFGSIPKAWLRWWRMRTVGQ